MLEMVTLTNSNAKFQAINNVYSSNNSNNSGSSGDNCWTTSTITYPQTTGGTIYPSDITISQPGTTIIWPPAILSPEQMQEIVDEVIRRLKAEGAEKIDLPSIVKEKIRDKKSGRLLRPIVDEK